MRSTFRIHFYVNRSKKRSGIVPVMGRITINGTIAQFSCRCAIPENLWSVSQNQAIGKSSVSEETNAILNTIRSKITYSYNKLSFSNPLVTARMVKEDFTGTGNDYKTLVSYMEKEMNLFRDRVGKDRAKKTWQKMNAVRGHLQEFLHLKYKTDDIYLQETDKKFLVSFSRYLSTFKGLSQSTVWVYCTYLKSILHSAYCNGYITQDNYSEIKFSPQVKERCFLSEEELKRIVETPINDPKVSFSRDVFVFCCFTGLSFVDMMSLKCNNIVTIGREKWIISKRKKTNKQFQIKLLKHPLQIIEKYHSKNFNQMFLNANYGTLRRHLKKAAEICRIKKHVTFHTARHTFATMALSNGMPIESLSKILGHTNISTTQIYAKIVNQKLDKDFSLLGKRLENIFN